MKVSKLQPGHIFIFSRSEETRAGKLAARGISVALAALIISLFPIFLLQALKPDADLVRRLKLHEDAEHEIAQAPIKPKSPSISRHLSVEKDTARAAPSGKGAVELLPRGEPGGRVVGRGRDIQGVCRLVRIQHELADWWADQSSLVALTQWMNTQTRIKTDI